MSLNHCVKQTYFDKIRKKIVCLTSIMVMYRLYFLLLLVLNVILLKIMQVKKFPCHLDYFVM